MKQRKFLPIALAISSLSKDETKVGAVIIGPDGEGGPWGYNGAPRGCHADEDERMHIRELKLAHFEHAERNAIFAAARQGFATKGCGIVVTHFPCINCARAIVQAGLKWVLCPPPEGRFLERWGAEIELSRALFHECGIELKEVTHDHP